MPANDSGTSTRTVAGRYRLGPTIGAGANAKVFDAVDLTDGSPVVVKMLPAAFGASGGFMKRFNTDLQMASELDHPNIAKVRDFGVERANNRQYPFVVTDLLAGGSLRGILDRGRQLTPSQALVVGLDVCRGLDFAHKRGLVHGAITPSNLLFGLDRRVRIADFGLSRLMGEVAWADPGRVDVHVAHYASPEHAMGVPIEAKSDVYALCLTLIESVTGTVPFASDTTVTTLASRVDKLMPVSADLGPLAAVLERGGRPILEDRFTAAQFGRALVQTAEKMPRPEAIPIVGIGMFGDVTGTLPQIGDAPPAERPLDITGTLERAEARAAEAPVVEAPVVEPPVVEPPVVAAPEAPSAPVVERPRPAVVPPVVVIPIIDEPVAFDPVPVRTTRVASVPPAVVPPDEGALRVPEPNVPPPIDDMERPAPVSARILSEPEPVAPVLPAVPGEPVLLPAESPVAAPADWSTLTGGVRDSDPTVHDAELPAIVTAESPAFDPGPASAEYVDDLDDVDRLDDDVDVDADWHVAAAARKATTTVESVEGDDDALNLDRRSLFSYVLVALGLVVAAVVGVVGYRALSTPSHEVPSLIGVPEAEARNQIAAYGWNVEVTRQRDDTQVQGDVIRTDPSAGEQLEKGATFVIVVSDGPTLATLPEITNLPLEQARALLSAAGLALREAKQVTDEIVPAGTVIAWSVPAQDGLVAGGQVPKGTTIEVTVSSGPSPRDVPSLVGLTVEGARQALTDLGLAVGSITEEFNDQLPAGQVISSDPGPGEGVARDTPIDLVVSKGADLATVPSLIGKTKAELDAALAEAGLLLGSITGPVDGVVAGTDIGAGTKVPRGTKISVIFGTT